MGAAVADTAALPGEPVAVHETFALFHRTQTVPGALPGPVLKQARRCLIDLVGVAAAGSRTELAVLIAAHAATQFGAGTNPATILFDAGARKASPAGAALAGGMTIDAIDAHDGHPLTKGHAGCGLFPALLAIAETEAPDMPLDEFLAHLTIGYEIAIRCGIALHATAPDYHTSGAWVAVGVALSGALMTGANSEIVRHAAGIAEYHGPRSQMMRCIDHPTMLKDGSGWGAMAGVSALMLARSGFTGAPALTVEEAAVTGIWSDLGTRWRIMEQYLKPWPVCRWAQPAVEAALDLRSAHGVASDTIGRVRVRSFHEAIRLATARPADTEQAQYALPFPVAAALVHGRLGVAQISGEGLRDATVLDLAERVELSESAAFNDLFPAERWAEVELELTGGRVLASKPLTARGDADAPLSDAEISSKFHALMDEAGYGDRATRIEDMMMAGAATPATVSDLVACCSASS
ncbi:MmgE/PrpD family protein [Oceaniradius stylonematis]|uniref:MmgE/PrpD family protein n=1 Tax=Oceaniradius stylonematis TaxID=2184161 RepID=A0A3A8AKG8_9HYPH|nr:MmgE/PrpD family protein [Oceaniradius stylonematis]RKF07164.1 MmgE/PrpD family protein [Oceaniradius stylonematis]